MRSVVVNLELVPFDSKRVKNCCLKICIYFLFLEVLCGDRISKWNLGFILLRLEHCAQHSYIVT